MLTDVDFGDAKYDFGHQIGKQGNIMKIEIKPIFKSTYPKKFKRMHNQMEIGLNKNKNYYLRQSRPIKNNFPWKEIGL